ncbi:hypothetical protein, partial [Nonomuraea ferruginea]|uniref:hypothetical protein n=1 Tax=Nonomuraea ferruginea TaxID=46174 RepID=UPI00360CF4D8
FPQLRPQIYVLFSLHICGTRGDLATSAELREFGGMPEGVPVFEVVPGPRKHRKVLRGDHVELIFEDAPSGN